MSTCGRCSDAASVSLHTGFGVEALCVPCRDAVRKDGQEIAAPYPLSLEDFAACMSWREYIRLASMGLTMTSAARFRVRQGRRGNWLLKDGKRTEWTGIVEGRHRRYLENKAA